MLGKLKLIRYKGLYAFLGGVMTFAVCFGGTGEITVPNTDLAAEETTLINQQSIPLSNVPYPVSGGEEQTSPASRSENEKDHENRIAPFSQENTAVHSLDDHRNVDDDTQAAAITLSETENAVEDISEENNQTENTAEETSAVSDAAEAAAESSNKWQETEASGIKYVNTDGIYSREEALEGAKKVERYELNEKVSVTAETDTRYFKLDSGAFIHSDYLSDKETPKWTETEASGAMYVCRGGIYSREEAVEGSTKIKQYGLNDTVNVVSETNTGYYKLDTGEFIHSDYLSLTETVEYPLSDRYGQRVQSDWEKDLARQVVDIVNEIRKENGLEPFKTLDSLTAAAAERAWETTFYNSHTRPDGTKCFTVLDKYGLSDPSSKAENIAMWSSSPQAAVNAWMNDYAHRKAILGDYEYIGVGCYYIESDYYKYYWTQMFYTP